MTKPSNDPIVAARNVLHEVLRRDEDRDRVKNAAAVELGRRGGLKGGPARAEKLTAAQRSEIARKAGKAPKRPRAKG